MSATNQNSATWRHSRFVRHYLETDLRLVEERIMERYAERFSGRVLEVGCGAGRATGHLSSRAREMIAIDLSEPMLATARRHCPDVDFRLLNMVELKTLEGEFDVVIATCNVIDVLDDDDRRRFLVEAAGKLAPEGVLVFSSHNRAHIPLLKEPWQLPTDRLKPFVKSLLQLPLWTFNHMRLRKLEVHADDYDILNDAAHDWRLLQYYIEPRDQRRQLADAGLATVECRSLVDESVETGAEVIEETEIYYVARASEPGKSLPGGA